MHWSWWVSFASHFCWLRNSVSETNHQNRESLVAFWMPWYGNRCSWRRVLLGMEVEASSKSAVLILCSKFLECNFLKRTPFPVNSGKLHKWKLPGKLTWEHPKVCDILKQWQVVTWGDKCSWCGMVKVGGDGTSWANLGSCRLVEGIIWLQSGGPSASYE